MIVAFEFNLPEQSKEMLDAVEGDRMRKVLQEYDQQLSANIVALKNNPDDSAVLQITIEQRDLFRYICNYNNIHIYRDGQ